MEPTTIKVDRETTWERLNARKHHGDSFDDVITRLLDQCDDTATNAGDGGGQ